eukprot:TRINITY_DN6295_c0_g1_i2.p1 TRINITY_DN6295_c0_g1~~TRINITY_DN6295_c0_g1_i2.p1  ORF type:complete len:186 (+),score=19.74 TRINITY_DN6295_c0_g1_i2:124-681(+)
MSAVNQFGIPCRPITGLEGNPSCVAHDFARRDLNPARDITEAEFEKELTTNGPFVATIQSTPDLLHHLKNSPEEIYDYPVQQSDKITKYSTTVTGTGIGPHGKRYWVCQDAQVQDGQLHEYKIAAGSVVLRGVAQDIYHPIHFHEQQQQNLLAKNGRGDICRYNNEVFNYQEAFGTPLSATMNSK